MSYGPWSSTFKYNWTAFSVCQRGLTFGIRNNIKYELDTIISILRGKIFSIEQIFVYNILRMNFQTILYNLGIDLYSCSINIY